MSHLHASHPLVKAKGQVMIISIIFLAVVLILSSSLFANVTHFVNFGSKSILKEQTNSLAEAGIERALWQLNQTAGAYTGETSTALGEGTFTTTIQNKTGNLKTITATGYIPNSANAKAKRTIKLDAEITTSTISFNYAVQVGDGGLVMQNSSTIVGNVYALAPINGVRANSITGEAWSTSTITPSNIAAVSIHPNQTNPPPMPTVDYDYFKTGAENGGTVNCTGTLNISGSIGPKKYVGCNITISADATINGVIYIEGGNLEISGPQTDLDVSDSLGSYGTAIIATGTAYITQANVNPNFGGGYLMVVSRSTSSSAMTLDSHGANALFVALEGRIVLSNNTDANAVIAKTMLTQNSAIITYQAGLASAQFTTGPGGSWQLKRGTYKFFNIP